MVDAATGLADDALHFDDAVGDLGDLGLEQFAHEVAVGAREDDAHALALLAHGQHVGADDAAGAVDLAGDLLFLGQDRFGAAERDDQHAALFAHDGAGNDGVFAMGPVVIKDIALGFLERLDDDLLGDVGDDATKVFEFDRGLVLESADLAGLAVDRDREIADGVEALGGGLAEGPLDLVEDQVLVESALTADGVDEADEFAGLHGGHLECDSTAKGRCGWRQKKREPDGPRSAANRTWDGDGSPDPPPVKQSLA